MLEHALTELKKMGIKSVTLRSDNAGRLLHIKNVYNVAFQQITIAIKPYRHFFR